MLIDSIKPLPTGLSLNVSPLSKTWQVGQLLQALVVNRGEQGQIELQIGQEKVNTQTDGKRNINIGEKLTLRVAQAESQIILKIVEQKTTQPTKYLVEKLLRHSLPKADLKPIIDTLNTFATPKQKDRAVSELPQGLRQQFKKIAADIPHMTNIKTVHGLKQAIEKSGLFMEKRLDTAMPKPSMPGVLPPPKPQLVGDLKAGLLQLIKLINHTVEGKEGSKTIATSKQAEPASIVKQKMTVSQAVNTQQLPKEEIARLFELRQITDAAIAKIQVNQTGAIRSEENPLPNWAIDLPVKDDTQTTVIKIRINQEESPAKQEEKQSRWHLSLSFELEGLGNIDVRVSYIANEISSSIWAENSATYEAIEQNLSHLTERLSITGLNVSSIHCFHGCMAAETGLDRPERALLSVSL